MSTFNGAKISEIRIYDDPNNPQTSGYTVSLPVTALDAVIDPVTGKSLTEILAEQSGVEQSDFYELSSRVDTTETAIAGLGTVATKNTGTASGNVPLLDISGKLPTSVIPSYAITDVFTANSQELMLALDAHPGDVCIRSDVAQNYILQSIPATTSSNWVALAVDNHAVSSVNGKTGAVMLTDISGNAGTATKLATTRAINVSGDVSGTAQNFDGTAAITIPATLASVTRTNNTSTASVAFGGTFTAIDSVTTDGKGRVTAANTKTVTIPAAPTAVTGNAGTATKLATARAINVSGAATATAGGVSGTAQNFDGTGNITIAATIPAATASAAGVMLPAEKTKLGNIPVAGRGRQIFTANGTFTLLANTPYTVICMGAGGKGGTGNLSTNTYPSGSGGGGGSGYFKKMQITVTADTTVTVTVGAAGGTSAAGTTSFGSYLSAQKGSDGGSANSTGLGGSGGQGGNGGECGVVKSNSAYHGACMTHGSINSQGIYDAETQYVSEWEYGTRQSGYGAGGQGGNGTATGSNTKPGGSGGCGFVMPGCPNGGVASGNTGGTGVPGVCIVEW